MEIWKDIKDYEGYYQVSNLGRVRSVDRMVWNGKGYYLVKGEIKKLSPHRDGYLQIKLNKNGVHKMFTGQRLVATAFIPNPYNYPCVNHKNEDKTDNRVENLEWCTVEYNNNYNNINERRSLKMGKRVVQIDKNTVINVYDSCEKAAKKVGGWKTKIAEAARTKGKTAYGYRWLYV